MPDLIGEVFINNGDNIAIGPPGYPGAIQAFSRYEPVFHPVVPDNDGRDPYLFAKVPGSHPVRLFYGVPDSPEPFRYYLYK